MTSIWKDSQFPLPSKSPNYKPISMMSLENLNVMPHNLDIQIRIEKISTSWSYQNKDRNGAASFDDLQ